MRDGGSAIARGLAAGAVGGLAGAWAMSQFQKLWSKFSGDQGGGGGEPATVKAAEAVSEAAFGHELTKDEKSPAGRPCITRWARCPALSMVSLRSLPRR